MTGPEQESRLEESRALLAAAGLDVEHYMPKVESMAAEGYTSHELCGFARGLVKAARRRGEIE